MKRSLIPFLALVLLFVSAATAQGEWKWAHYWSGGDGSYSDYYNYITNTAFDDEGNIYVYGSMGGNAVFDGELFQFTTNAEVLSRNDHSVLLAKFDTLGNMLWHKVVKSVDEWAVPKWMEVRDNTVFVAANCGLYGFYPDSWLYYWDTLITKSQIIALPQEMQKPPYKIYSTWTCLAQFDLDGNLVEDHFFKTCSRDSVFTGSQWYRTNSTLCQNTSSPSPVHRDANGNYYCFTPIQYQGCETDPFTVVVDEDPDRTYDVHLTGSTVPGNSQSYINNAMLYKFSPQGELLFAKTLVDSTDGIAPTYSTGDTINRYFYVCYNGISYDEEDNMYVTGYVRLAEPMYGHGGELHDYPVHFWWDSTHCMTMNDISSANYCNFIVKYDTDGNVIWCNQVYTQVSTHSVYVQSFLYGSCVQNNSVYVCGDAEDYANTGTLIYFDNNPNNYVDRTSPEQQTRGFYVEFNKENGSYIKNSIVPANNLSVLGQHSYAMPAISDNQIVVFAATENNSNRTFGLARWCTNGFFIDYTPILLYPDQMMGTGPTILNDHGFVLTAPQIKGNISFGENVSLNGDAIHSNAVFALCQIAQPYTIIPSYTENTSYLRLWPNPTQNILDVESEKCPMDFIKIIDMEGKTVLQKHIGSKRATVNVSKLATGVYLLKAMCNDNEKTGKFVKTNY